MKKSTKKTITKKSKNDENDIRQILTQISFSDEKLSDENINYLLLLPIYNYDDAEFLLSKIDNPSKDFLMNIVSLLKTQGFEYVYDLLESNTDLLLDKNKSATEKRKEILMQNLNEEESILYIEINNFKNPIKISEGIVDCKRCKSKETISSQKQTRSGDEAVTITIYCFACKYRWNM